MDPYNPNSLAAAGIHNLFAHRLHRLDQMSVPCGSGLEFRFGRPRMADAPELYASLSVDNGDLANSFRGGSSHPDLHCHGLWSGPEALGILMARSKLECSGPQVSLALHIERLRLTGIWQDKALFHRLGWTYLNNLFDLLGDGREFGLDLEGCNFSILLSCTEKSPAMTAFMAGGVKAIESAEMEDSAFDWSTFASTVHIGLKSQVMVLH